MNPGHPVAYERLWRGCFPKDYEMLPKVEKMNESLDLKPRNWLKYMQDIRYRETTNLYLPLTQSPQKANSISLYPQEPDGTKLYLRFWWLKPAQYWLLRD